MNDQFCRSTKILIRSCLANRAGTLLVFAVGLCISGQESSAQSVISALKAIDKNQTVQTSLDMTRVGVATNCCVVNTKEARGFFDFWWDAAKEFDFSQVYSSGVLQPVPGTSRQQLSLFGKFDTPKYNIKVGEDSERQSYIKKNRMFGSGYVTIGLEKQAKKSQGDKIFQASFLSEAFLGNLQPAGVVLANKNLLGLISSVSKKTNAESGSKKSSLNSSSKKIIENIRIELPKFTSIFLKYFKVLSIVATPKNQLKPIIPVSLKIQLDTRALRKDYPNLAEWIESLKDALTSTFQISDAHGRGIIKGATSTTSRTSELVFFVKENGLQTFDSSTGQPLAANFAFRLPMNDEFSLTTQTKIELMGLHLDAGTTKIALTVKASNSDLKIDSKIVDIVKPSLTGKLFHIVPTWLMNLPISGDIQSRIDRFAQILSNKEIGRGAEGALQLTSSVGTSAKIRGFADLLDNSILNLGLKVGINVLVPNDQAIDELKKLNVAMGRAFESDIKGLGSLKK